jgi:hypothetical protein
MFVNFDDLLNEIFLFQDPDRWGNPKVSVGFPSSKTSFKLTSQSNGSCDNLREFLVDKSAENPRDSCLRKKAAQLEQGRKERASQAAKHAQQVEQFHRDQSKKLLEFEKKRENANADKIRSIQLAKKQIKEATNKRFDNK